MTTPYFTGLKVGDKIWTTARRYTEVICVNSYSEHPIITQDQREYSMDGFRMDEENQSAFWSDPKIVAPERPTPKTLDEEFDSKCASMGSPWSSAIQEMLRWILHKAVSEARK